MVIGVLKDVTGGTLDKPTLGVNFVVFLIAKDVTKEELQQYAHGVLQNGGSAMPPQNRHAGDND